MGPYVCRPARPYSSSVCALLREDKFEAAQNKPTVAVTLRHSSGKQFWAPPKYSEVPSQIQAVATGCFCLLLGTVAVAILLDWLRKTADYPLFYEETKHSSLRA